MSTATQLTMVLPLIVAMGGCSMLTSKSTVPVENSGWSEPQARNIGLRVEQVDGRFVYCFDCPHATKKTPYEHEPQTESGSQVEHRLKAITDADIRPASREADAVAPAVVNTKTTSKSVKLGLVLKREHSIPFAMGRQVLGKSGKALVAKLADQAKEAERILLYGSTDHTGSKELNTRLAFARAFAVRMQLIKEHSIDRNKITIKKGNIGMKEKPMHESGHDHRLRRVLAVLVQSSEEGSRETYLSQR